MSCFFYICNVIKLKINNIRKYATVWKLNLFLDDEGVTGKIKRETLKFLKMNKDENTTVKTYGIQKMQYESGHLQQ
jgi:hypothetical protein